METNHKDLELTKIKRNHALRHIGHKTKKEFHHIKQQLPNTDKHINSYGN